MADPKPSVPRSDRVPDWVFQGLLVLVSVGLGFGLAQFGQYRNDRELLDRALARVAAEVDENVKVIEPFVSMHNEWVIALSTADTLQGPKSGIDIFFDSRPPLPRGAASPFPRLESSAWDAAVSSGAIRLMDYEVGAALAEIYRVQEIVTENINRLATGALSLTDTYDPARGLPSARLLWLTLADIQSAEALLLAKYREHLPTVRQDF